MFRTIRPLVASAVCTVSLFALSATALAMPAAPDPAPGYVPDPPAVTTHASSTSMTVWIIAAVVLIALLATALTFVTMRRDPGSRVARG